MNKTHLFYIRIGKYFCFLLRHSIQLSVPMREEKLFLEAEMERTAAHDATLLLNPAHDKCGSRMPLALSSSLARLRKQLQ